MTDEEKNHEYEQTNSQHESQVDATTDNHDLIPPQESTLLSQQQDSHDSYESAPKRLKNHAHTDHSLTPISSPLPMDISSSQGDNASKAKLSKARPRRKMGTGVEDLADDEQRRKDIPGGMSDCEKEFTSLKEKLFDEQILGVTREIDAVSDETHPEFLEELQKLSSIRRNKLLLAERLRDYQVENIMNHYRAERAFYDTECENEKKQLKERLLLIYHEKVRRLEEEKASLVLCEGVDAKSILRSLRRRNQDGVPIQPYVTRKKHYFPPLPTPLRESEQAEDLMLLQKMIPLPLKTYASMAPLSVFAEKGRLVYQNQVFEKGHEVFVEGPGFERLRGIVSTLGVSDIQVKTVDGTKQRISVAQLRSGKCTIMHLEK
eukprot:TRINITY_DN11686_c0_g1_i1.p1 TRINITY_DN11686_c0_g1~~TRINITY_DN11686_c0_g1_i1.p1  ORF type:complete len:403 (-),score=113.88 TRINITY_DN11686_c0_g1_i1:332-1459(-)